ncbi:hypothetical protein O6H91_08G116800 [Diphasiastrum complanatum]|nr:hypothetical protein O6H91_08G116800 [Diphasiastrum complanatum]
MTTITEPAAAKSHLRAVAASKRLKSPYTGWDGDASANTVRRRPRPLFQYRYYSEQQPLRLSEVEIEEVITAVCSVGASSSSTGLALVPVLPNNQTGNIVLETADIAASVLIKLLIDMYMADSRTAAPLTLSILEGMLSSSVKAVRIRAFDLMLNLGIHAHLLEPSHSEDHEDVHEEAMFKVSENGSVSSSLSDLRVQQATPRAVVEFEAWLLEVLSDMLLFLVQVEEQEEGVWAAALSSLFYLICDRGRIRRRGLRGVDIRVLKSLLEVSRQNAWAEEIHCRLVQIASNMLFSYTISGEDSFFEEAVLDLDKLEMMGGIEAICIEYAAVNSMEAKHNLFVLIFDYVLAQLKHKATVAGKPHSSNDEIQAIATVLVMAEAPEAISVALRDNLQVSDALAKSIIKAFARDIVSGRLNVMLLEEITGLLDVLVAKHTSLDDEFQDLASKMSLSDEITRMVDYDSTAPSTFESSNMVHGWATLHALLHSSQPNCRSHGYLWLIKLFSSEFERASLKETGPLSAHSLQQQFDLLEKSSADSSDTKLLASVSPAVRLLCGLLKSPDPSIRQGFVLVLERLLSQYERVGFSSENTYTSLSDSDATIDQLANSNEQEFASSLVSLMNAALWQVISANDTYHSSILQMCNLMFSNLCLKWPPSAIKSDRLNQRSKSMDGVQALNSVTGSVRSVNEGESSGKSWDKSSFTERTSSMTTGINGRANDNAPLSSVAALLLRDEAAAPKLLVASIPTALLYWPLMQLSGAPTEDVTLGVAVGSRGGGNVPGGVSDVRAALLLLLIGKCIVQPGAFEDVGGEEFFRLLLDDCDARVSYYSSSFLLKRMMNEEPEKYQRILHNLVFKAQQSNNEKLLENPYLQMRGILQLSSDSNKSQAYLPYDG